MVLLSSSKRPPAAKMCPTSVLSAPAPFPALPLPPTCFQLPTRFLSLALAPFLPLGQPLPAFIPIAMLPHGRVENVHLPLTSPIQLLPIP